MSTIAAMINSALTVVLGPCPALGAAVGLDRMAATLRRLLRRGEGAALHLPDMTGRP